MAALASIGPAGPADKTAPAMAQRVDDETARILGEYGTPEKLLGYLLTEAERRKRKAYSAVRAQRGADTDPAARQRYEAAYEAAYETAHAEWTAEVAYVAAEYALNLGAAAPGATSGTDDLASPYNLGWRSGADMLVSDITHRPSDYDDGQWREYVAGYAEGTRPHAEATAAYAQAVQERAQENPPVSSRATASPGKEPVMVQAALEGEPGRDEAAAPGLAAGPDFPGAPAGRPAASAGGRAAGTGIASHAGQARPGRRR